MSPSVEWCLLGGRCAHVGAGVLLGKGGEDSVQDHEGKGEVDLMYGGGEAEANVEKEGESGFSF